MTHAGDGASDGQKCSVLISSDQRALCRTTSEFARCPLGELERFFPTTTTHERGSACITGLCWLSQLVSPLAHFAGWSATGRLIHGPPSFRLLTTDLSELFTRSTYPLPRLTQLFPKRLPTFSQAALAALFSPMLEWKRLTRDWNIHKYLVITYANTQVVSVSQTVKTFTGESLKKGCTFMQCLSCKYSSWHLNCWLFSVNFCIWN